MHALEIITVRNAEIAGRAEAHARNDGDVDRAEKILAAFLGDPTDLEAYERGFRRARQEG